MEENRGELTNHQNIAYELRRIWRTFVKVLPAVIATTGSFKEDMFKEDKLDIGSKECTKLLFLNMYRFSE